MQTDMKMVTLPEQTLSKRAAIKLLIILTDMQLTNMPDEYVRMRDALRVAIGADEDTARRRRDAMHIGTPIDPRTIPATPRVLSRVNLRLVDGRTDSGEMM